MIASWYAIRSKPNKEAFLARQLEAQGINIYFPRIHTVPVNPRARKSKPYFPGYLFVQVDLNDVNISTLQWTPGAANLVSFGGEPASVPEVLITNLQKHLGEINESKKSITNFVNRGETVLITDGPFAGYEAIFDGMISGQERVRVLLNFLQKRRVSVELQSSQIGRVKRS
jgi:transcriptional antiterminator RfaH